MNQTFLLFSPQISFELSISESRREKLYPAGELNKQGRIFRLPNEIMKKSYSFEREFEIKI